MISIQSLSAAQQQFASRFSLEDWQQLCSNDKFLDALNRLAFDEAEVVAWTTWSARDQAAISSLADAQLRYEKLHLAAREFVAVWARKTGRTGGQHKQTRQAHIRRLVKHGLDSDYARKMLAEAGL